MINSVVHTQAKERMTEVVVWRDTSISLTPYTPQQSQGQPLLLGLSLHAFPGECRLGEDEVERMNE
jgi:hypothetical protein